MVKHLLGAFASLALLTSAVAASSTTSGCVVSFDALHASVASGVTTVTGKAHGSSCDATPSGRSDVVVASIGDVSSTAPLVGLATGREVPFKLTVAAPARPDGSDLVLQSKRITTLRPAMSKAARYIVPSLYTYFGTLHPIPIRTTLKGLDAVFQFDGRPGAKLKLVSAP